MGSRPKTTIVGSVLLAVLCMMGFMNFEQEARSEKLWVSQSTESITDMDYVTDTWNYDPRYNQLLAKTEGSTALTPDSVRAFYARHQSLMQIRVDSEKKDLYPGSFNFSEACFRRGDQVCQQPDA